MIRVIIGGILGAVVYFVWGMVVWFFLDLHKSSVHGIPTESAVTEFLKEQKLESGFYYAPFTEETEEMEDEDSAFYKRHLSGPIYSISYQKEGEVPMPVKRLIGGFVIDLLASFLVAGMLLCAASGYCKSYTQRVIFVTGMGLFVALIGHASYWNWMHFPLDYTLMFIVDVVVGWLLVGLVMAAIVRCPNAPAQV